MERYMCCIKNGHNPDFETYFLTYKNIYYFQYKNMLEKFIASIISKLNEKASIIVSKIPKNRLDIFLDSGFYFLKMKGRFYILGRRVRFEKDELCRLKVRFPKQVLRKFKFMLDKKYEISGNMIGKFDSNDVLILKHGKVSNGNGRESDFIEGDITFHTHPKEMYYRYDSKYGWPSSKDYRIFAESCNNMRFHILAAVEGFYIVTMNKCGNVDKDTISKYKIPKNSNFTPLQYVKSINNIPDQVFSIKFFKWDDVDTTISISKLCLVK